MDNRPAVISPNLWIVTIVALAIVVGLIAVVRIDRSGKQGSGLSDEFDYNIEDYVKIDPALILYHQTQEIPAGMQEARAVAVGPLDRIYVAGDEAIHVFGSDGATELKIALDGPPYSLAVGGASHAFPGRVYVGLKDHVALFDSRGKPAGTWEGLGDRAVLTSIALAIKDVFVADAGNFVVLRYDTSGKLIGRIGERSQDREIPGFVVPSPFFDVAVHPDGWLRVANTGELRIEAYSFDGNLELFWGKSAAAIEGFFGCCNPANFTILPDGRFVTAEKGLLRVKIYSRDGQFECVVAGPEQFNAPTALTNKSLSDQEYTAVDVAADGQGRIVILDRPAGSVRIFERNNPIPEQNNEQPE